MKDGKFENVPSSEKDWPADLVFLAVGFLGPEHTASDALGLDYDERSNYKADYGQYKTNVDNVFVAGDCRRGQSLVVRAINEDREAARKIDRHLMGSTELPENVLLRALGSALGKHDSIARVLRYPIGNIVITTMFRHECMLCDLPG